jgi:hypothetical protein
LLRPRNSATADPPPSARRPRPRSPAKARHTCTSTCGQRSGCRITCRRAEGRSALVPDGQSVRGSRQGRESGLEGRPSRGGVEEGLKQAEVLPQMHVSLRIFDCYTIHNGIASVFPPISGATRITSSTCGADESQRATTVGYGQMEERMEDRAGRGTRRCGRPRTGAESGGRNEELTN